MESYKYFMQTLQAVFDQVTPASLSGDLTLSLLLIFALSLYILKKGSADIVILSLAVYLSRFFTSISPWQVASVGVLPGSLVLFLIITGICIWILHKSPMGKTLSVAKKPLWLNLLFGISVMGLTLSSITQYRSLGASPVSIWIEKSLFSQQSWELFWTVLPVIFYVLLGRSGRK